MNKKTVCAVAFFALGLIMGYEALKTNSKIKNIVISNEAEEKEVISIQNHKDLFFIKPEKEPLLVHIKVYKEIRRLELYGDDKLIGRFKIALGGEPIGDKHKEGDMKTPEGKYYICTRNDKSKYTLFLGLSYPNVEDAQRGVENALIGESEYKEVKIANENKKRPNWNTPLGGAVGIHGGGTSNDWTWGCIAVSDEDIKIIWEYTKMNTPVEIYK